MNHFLTGDTPAFEGLSHMFNNDKLLNYTLNKVEGETSVWPRLSVLRADTVCLPVRQGLGQFKLEIDHFEETNIDNHSCIINNGQSLMLIKFYREL